MGQFAQAMAEREATQQQRCIMGRLIEGFDEDDIAVLERLLGQSKMQVVRDLLGGRPGEGAVRLHGQGRCCCDGDVPGKGAMIRG